MGREAQLWPFQHKPLWEAGYLYSVHHPGPRPTRTNRGFLVACRICERAHAQNNTFLPGEVFKTSAVVSTIGAHAGKPPPVAGAADRLERALAEKDHSACAERDLQRDMQRDLQAARHRGMVPHHYCEPGRLFRAGGPPPGGRLSCSAGWELKLKPGEACKQHQPRASR